MTLTSCVLPSQGSLQLCPPSPSHTYLHVYPSLSGTHSSLHGVLSCGSFALLKTDLLKEAKARHGNLWGWLFALSTTLLRFISFGCWWLVSSMVGQCSTAWKPHPLLNHDPPNDVGCFSSCSQKCHWRCSCSDLRGKYVYYHSGTNAQGCNCWVICQQQVF